MQNGLAAKIFGDKEDPRQRLQSIFGGSSPEVGAGPVALEWAKKTLHDAGVDPAGQKVAAIRRLRSAQPRLALKAAAYLVDDVSRR